MPERKNARLAPAAVLALAAVIVGVLAAAVPSRIKPERPEIVFMAADDHPKDYPTTQGLFAMKEYLEDKTGGRISMDIFHSKTLGAEKVTIEQTQLGIIDINRVNVNPLVQLAPELGVFALPYIFDNTAHMRAVLDGPVGDELLLSLEDKGLVGLAYYDSGARSFYNTRRPIEKPEDLEGLKIRVQKSEIMMDMVSALGGSPTPMDFGEVYTSLSTGVIQGAENNWPSYDYTRHFEVATYYSLDQHSMAPEVVLVSKKTWDKLSPDDQALLDEAAKASVEKQRRLWEELVAKAKERVLANGNKVNDIPNKSAFQKKVRPVYDKHVKGARMKDLVERIGATKAPPKADEAEEAPEDAPDAPPADGDAPIPGDSVQPEAPGAGGEKGPAPSP